MSRDLAWLGLVLLGFGIGIGIGMVAIYRGGGNGGGAVWGRHVKWQTPNPNPRRSQKHSCIYGYFCSFMFFFFCVSLSSVCRLLICLPLALSLCHHRHRDYPHYEHVSIARCMRGGERFLQCQQVDQDKGVPTIHPSNQCPIPISDPFPPRDSHSHSQSSGQTWT